jgi:hypothetical protein
MVRRGRRRAGLVGLVVLMPIALSGQAAPAGAAPPSILGYWRGQSTCVKAAWNAACKDEAVVYHVVPAAKPPGQVVLNAFKAAGGGWEPMYDLQLAWDTTRHQWAARYSNSRVRILWSYSVKDTLLVGRLVDLPDERLVRDVLATYRPDSAAAMARP